MLDTKERPVIVYTNLQSVKTQSMVLLKAACDAGVATEAMEVIRTSSTETDSLVPWSRVVSQLEALLASHRVPVRRVNSNPIRTSVSDGLEPSLAHSLNARS
jgi:hypothetical protein